MNTANQQNFIDGQKELLPSPPVDPPGTLGIHQDAAVLQQFDNLNDAIKGGASLEVIRPLIEKYKTGVDVDHSAPLKMAVEHSAACSLEVVEALISAFPSTLRCVLQAAAHQPRIDLEVLRAVVAADLEGVKVADERGRLPLHYAAQFSESCEAVQVWIDAYPEGASCKDREGSLPLHIAPLHCKSVDVIRSLIAAFPDGITCKTVHGHLPLHIAAWCSKSDDVVKTLIDAFPEGITCTDKRGCLPLHIAARYSECADVIGVLIGAYPEGVHVLDNYGHLPVNLSIPPLSSAELAAHWINVLKGNPTAVRTSRRRTLYNNVHLQDIWRAYNRGLAPTVSDVSNFYVHICGEPNAGKSIVFHWISEILKQNRSIISRVGDFIGFNPTSHSITPDDRRATRGMVSNTVPYTTQDGRALHCILHDYGAQAQFKLTHPQHLSCPASIYVIVLPLYSMETGVWYAISDLRAQLLDWLRMIYSVKYVSIQEYVDGNAAQVPVLVVVNTFATVRKANEKPISFIQIQELIADMKRYFTDIGSLVQELFHFMDPVLIDARAKGDAYSLEHPLIAASEMVCGAKKYSRYDCVEFVLNHLPVWPSLLMTKEDVLVVLAAVLKDNDYQGLSARRALQKDTPACLEGQQPSRRLAEFCFKVMVEMKHLLVLNSVQEQARNVVTNPNVLTNQVIGEVLHVASKKSVEGIHRAVPLVYSSVELNHMVPDLPSGITVAMVLDALGLALPVSLSRTNEILPATAAESNAMYLMGLVDETMPAEVKNVCLPRTNSNAKVVFDVLEGSSLGMTVVRSVSRLFCLQNNRCSFIPGFFMKLFMCIHNLNSHPDRCWYWKDGMVMKSRLRWNGENGLPIEGIKEVLVYPFNDHGMEGFIVTISVWVHGVPTQTPITNWGGCFHPNDIVLDDLNSIRRVIMSKEHWKISVGEHVLLEGSNVPYLLHDAEMDWFANEASRTRIRISLIGYFSQYNSSLIAQESDLALSLSKGSDIEQTFCEWNGIVEDLVKNLRALDIAEDDLKLWIVRYYRCRSMTLCVKDCDAIVKAILSVEDPALARPSQHKSEVDQAVIVTVGDSEIQESTINTTPSGPTENQQILQTLDMILRGQQAARERYVEDSRRVHVYPLLAVLSPYQATGIRGAAKAFAGAGVGITTHRVHFHCTVCGCRSPTAGKGYKLALGSNATKKVLKAFHLSLSVLQLMLQIGGVPNQISAIAEFAINSLDILASDLKEEFLKIAEVQDNEQLRTSLTYVMNEASTASAGGMSAQRSVLLDPSKTSQRKEKVVTRQHIAAITRLFEALKDPEAEESGLEKAISTHFGDAWVCGPAEDGSKSFCYTEFMAKGQDVIGVFLKYV